ncbi:MAG: hypothetical protein ACR2QU_10750, partial [Gammaproteobacteria bacterium]
FLNSWLDLRIALGTTDRLFDYWILGHELNEVEPRWSVIRNVFGWGMDTEGSETSAVKSRAISDD